MFSDASTCDSEMARNGTLLPFAGDISDGSSCRERTSGKKGYRRFRTTRAGPETGWQLLIAQMREATLARLAFQWSISPLRRRP